MALATQVRILVLHAKRKNTYIIFIILLCLAEWGTESVIGYMLNICASYRIATY